MQGAFVGDAEFGQLAALQVAQGVTAVNHVNEVDVARQRLAEEFAGRRAVVVLYLSGGFEPFCGFEVGVDLACIHSDADDDLTHRVQAGGDDGVQRLRGVLVFLPGGI